MKHTENETKILKSHHIEMWNLVQNQIHKAFDALQHHNKALAHEVLACERVVNAQELVVDHHCEDFIALFAPVAIDLRFVLSLLKITNNLERIGDFAESIALFVIHHQTKPLDKVFLEELELVKMMETAEEMLSKARQTLVLEKSTDCGNVMAMDDVLDTINRKAVKVIARQIQNNPDATEELLHIHAVIRRIERIGDRISNIVEDIVFFVDAKELRHLKK